MENTDKRGYRPCVRVIVIKDDKILLGKKIIGGEFVGYEFPGGGIENHASHENTVVRECLEELGMLVTDVRPLHITFRYDVNYPNPERAKLYKGGIDHWYQATFIKTDNSVKGADGDVLPVTWEYPDDAAEIIKHGPKSKYSPSRLKAISIVSKYMKARDKRNKANSW